MAARRRVCFVTGTRAEFGLMRSTLRAIADHPRLRLQIAATGMHLHAAYGRTVDAIRADGWRVDATVPWPLNSATSPRETARSMGGAIARLPGTYHRLRSDVVLVVGDRVEAFAAAAAAHVAGLPVAHVHGGDRALGQVDDALRHAITKLAHVHFPATAASAARLLRLGEDRWRIHRVGSPGIVGIAADAAGWDTVAREFPGLTRRRFALCVLHPTSADEVLEADRASKLLAGVFDADVPHAVAVYPNNDPGSTGIAWSWEAAANDVPHRVFVRRDLPRPLYLGLLRDAAVLVGNSSSGIIEAASFGTPVVDVGPRQQGREHGANVVHAGHPIAAVRRAAGRVWNDGRPVRFPRRNVYGRGDADRRIADVLARVALDDRTLRKLIAY